jgi:hypothetical protein
MKITCECSNKTEYNELIKQLRDEGLDYRATAQETLDGFYKGNPIYNGYTQYFVVFWYDGKLI